MYSRGTTVCPPDAVLSPAAIRKKKLSFRIHYTSRTGYSNLPHIGDCKLCLLLLNVAYNLRQLKILPNLQFPIPYQYSQPEILCSSERSVQPFHFDPPFRTLPRELCFIQSKANSCREFIGMHLFALLLYWITLLMQSVHHARFHKRVYIFHEFLQNINWTVTFVTKLLHLLLTIPPEGFCQPLQ